MCLAIVKPAGKKISYEHLENGFDHNGDGAGFAYAENGILKISKGFFKFARFFNAYKTHEDAAMLIHFRQQTHGPKNKANCHPWAVGSSLALIHNGIINIKPVDKLSDTGTFVELVLKPLIYSGVAFNSPALQFLAEEAIGTFNKVAMMDRKGVTVIWNEKEGITTPDGVWYSNRSFEGYWGATSSVGFHSTWDHEGYRTGDTSTLRTFNGSLYKKERDGVWSKVNTTAPVKSAASSAEVLGNGTKGVIAVNGSASARVCDEINKAAAEHSENGVDEIVEAEDAADAQERSELKMTLEALTPGSFDLETEAEIEEVMRDNNCSRYDALHTLLLL